MAGSIKNISVAKYAEISAESLLAELLANGYGAEQLVINRQSSFRKLYRKDVDKLEIRQADEGASAEVTLHVNRDGIYDVLPEGLFHQPVHSTNKGSDLDNMIGESRRLKEEEKRARLFFKPFDQEMLGYATQVEQEERKLMQRILWGNFAEDPYSFWGIPHQVPQKEAATLSGIMPWAYLIKGNLMLTAKVIEMLVGCKVSAKEKMEQYQAVQAGSLQMDGIILGQDSVLGSRFWEGGIIWAFTIHKIPAAKMELYTSKGYIGQILHFFADIFLPVEIDVAYEYETENLEKNEAAHILGFGFVL